MEQAPHAVRGGFLEEVVSALKPEGPRRSWLVRPEELEGRQREQPSQGRGEGAEEQSGVAGVLCAMRVAARGEVRGLDALVKMRSLPHIPGLLLSSWAGSAPGGWGHTLLSRLNHRFASEHRLCGSSRGSAVLQ